MGAWVVHPSRPHFLAMDSPTPVLKELPVLKPKDVVMDDLSLIQTVPRSERDETGADIAPASPGLHPTSTPEASAGSTHASLLRGIGVVLRSFAAALTSTWPL